MQSARLVSIITRLASPQRNNSIRASRRRLRPIVSCLEARTLLSAFTVTNTQNEGDGSLRWAMTEANSSPGSDTIDFEPSVFDTPREIRLFSILPSLADPSATTIQGPGADLLTLSGQGKTNILNVSVAGKAILSGLTLSDGRAGRGGAVFNSGELTVIDCKISRNTAESTGGAIFNAGRLVMTASTVASNTASLSGGGIYTTYYGSVILTGCTFDANKAETGDGGADFMAKRAKWFTSILKASGCTFKSNSAAHLGGGIYSGNGNVTLTGCTIDKNRTLAGDGAGAGVFNSNGILAASASTFSNNDATVRGGGLDNADGGTATLNGCTFVANQAVYGAGIDNGIKSKLTMVNSSELDNNSDKGGGRYRNDSSGGGLFTSGNTVLIASTIASNSVASYGGGIEESGGTTIATNCTIARNYSDEIGSGILIMAGTINLMNCTVAQNMKGLIYRGHGVGLYVAPDATANVVNTVIVDNLFPSTATQFVFYIGNTQGTIHGQNNEIQPVSTWNPPNTVVGSLSSNGGPTLTMALLPGSPAIGRGAPPSASNPNVPTVDQRGEPRNGVTDIGAYQYSGNQ